MENVGHKIANNRARDLNKKSHKRSADKMNATKTALFQDIAGREGLDFQTIAQANMGELWRKHVKNRNDAEAFMEIMYPQLPKQVQLAYVDMFERAIKGEIALDDKMIYNEKDKQDTWNPLEDIEKERTAGLINLTGKRLDKLLEEEKTAYDMPNK